MFIQEAKVVVIEPSAWKKLHQLRGKDKEGGRQRALQLFPAAHSPLARKRCGRRGTFLRARFGGPVLDLVEHIDDLVAFEIVAVPPRPPRSNNLVSNRNNVA